MSLHDRIINLPTDKRCPEDMPARLFYKQGHRDARHAAAEMTLEADELMAEMAEALSLYVKSGHGMSTDFQQQGDARQSALYALDRYKESTK